METVKRDRKQHRRLFTRACNAFDEEENELSAADKITKLKLIEEKAMLIITCEENFKQLLYAEGPESISDIEIDREVDESEEYIDRWRSLKRKLEQLSLNGNGDSVPSYSSIQQNALLHYPKIKLPTFDGDVRNWIYFWGQFKKIDLDVNIDLHDKFAYLSQAMENGSPADELVKSFPPGGSSYEKALQQLKARFGRDELLIQVYVRDLLTLVLQKHSYPKVPLRKLYDQLESKLRSLELLGVTQEKYAAMLFPLVESSLSAETLVAWERYRSAYRRNREGNLREQNKNITERSDLESILEFLQDEVEAEERILLASQNFNNSKSKVNINYNNRPLHEEKSFRNKIKNKHIAEVPSAVDLLTSSPQSKRCLFCSNSHYSGDCLKARKLSLKERESLVQQSHWCFLCLKPGHPVRKCNLKTSCLCCGKRHHILLCRNMQQTTSYEEREENKVNPEVDQALANVSINPHVMLQTFKVIIRGNGKNRTARAIIDTASQRSYLLRDTARELNYKPESYEYLQHSLFGGKNTGVCKHDIFTLYLSSVHGNYNCNFKVLSQSIICESIPPVVNHLCLEELTVRDISVVDNCKDPIEILIGADVAGKLLTGERHELPCGLVAIETKLGWSVMGRMSSTTSSDSSSLVATCMLSATESLTDLWTLDTLGITDPSVKKSRTELQEAARQHFLNTVRIEDNRYIVNLPCLEDHPPLPDYFRNSIEKAKYNG